jgi:hypothetical protein
MKKQNVKLTRIDDVASVLEVNGRNYIVERTENTQKPWYVWGGLTGLWHDKHETKQGAILAAVANELSIA